MASLVSVVKWFLGNIRDQDYVNLVNRLLESFHKLGCNVSIKVHLYIATCINSQ